MKINVKRYSSETSPKEDFIDYEVNLESPTLLKALHEIKTNQDATLTYSSGCRSSVCGSCAVRVNGREVLACAYKVQDGDRVEHLGNVEVIRDLVVNMDKALECNATSKAWLSQKNPNAKLSIADEKINEIQSDCILCGSCYSVCPVYAVNDAFKGPFALTRVWKYVSDKRELDSQEKIDTVQSNGIWDCTLCNECTVVCPQGISSKADIEKLRMKSAAFGYSDPNFANMDFSGGLSF